MTVLYIVRGLHSRCTEDYCISLEDNALRGVHLLQWGSCKKRSVRGAELGTQDVASSR